MRAQTLAAASLVWVVGALLRLYDLHAMEFKADERLSLEMALQLLHDRPWSTLAPWPSHGLVSSSGVGNAPLFTWIVAAFWMLTPHPVGVTALIAASNALCLVPLWVWARRRMDERRALLTLAIMSVSPFAVLFSRKIWPVDLLLPGLLAVLWGVEWFRDGRVWRAVALGGFGILLISQLHQSGLITAPLLLVALAIQAWVDRRRGSTRPIPRPTPGEMAAIAGVVAAHAFLWSTYLPYLVSVPAEVFANRPRVDGFEPQLFLNLIWEIVPRHVLVPFSDERTLFRADPIRSALYYGSLVLGAPLAAYGVWRWLRSPLTLPVVGLWWWLVVTILALARVPSYPYYVLAVMPLPALLAAGAFDGPMPEAAARALLAWRWLYVAALLALTIVCGQWVAGRGGSLDDYGVTFNIQEAQAQALSSRARGQQPALNTQAREVALGAQLLSACQPVTAEVAWIAGWLERPPPELDRFDVCGSWTADGYHWAIRERSRIP
jgi:hypothetical protein